MKMQCRSCRKVFDIPRSDMQGITIPCPDSQCSGELFPRSLLELIRNFKEWPPLFHKRRSR